MQSFVQRTRKRSVACREAFTLVELLAVIAIIGTLLGLLLPAVQAARESSRRSVCSNNIKEVTLACANYEQGRRTLPPGAYSAFGITWWHSLLPFIDAADLFAKYDPRYAYQGGPTTPYTNLNTLTGRVNNMACPSDNGPLTHQNGTGQRYNYAANAGNVGMTYNANTATGMSRTASRLNGSTTITNGGEPFRFEGTNPTSNANGNLLIGYTAGRTPPQIQLRHVTDGLSKTLAFAELLRGTNGIMESGSGPFSDVRGSPWHSNHAYFTAWLLPNSRTSDSLAGSTNTCRPTADAPCRGNN